LLLYVWYFSPPWDYLILLHFWHDRSSWFFHSSTAAHFKFFQVYIT
jgi:hypothetical protein